MPYDLCPVPCPLWPDLWPAFCTCRPRNSNLQNALDHLCQWWTSSIRLMSLLREPLLTRSTAEGEKLKPRAGSHYRLIFILAGWKKKVTQLEMKIKLITLGLHFNHVKIKNFNHRQSAGKFTFTLTNHAGPNRALYITIPVLLFSAIQKQRNQRNRRGSVLLFRYLQKMYWFFRRCLEWRNTLAEIYSTFLLTWTKTCYLQGENCIFWELQLQ